MWEVKPSLFRRSEEAAHLDAVHFCHSPFSDGKRSATFA
jgi:hypothetical protein